MSSRPRGNGAAYFLGEKGSDPGFTLIEVLVVVAIVGIVVAVAAINLFPDEKQAARREASEVAIAIEHARDTAWYGGLPTALSFEPRRLREWRLTGDQWQADAAHELVLGPTVRVAEIRVDGQPLTDKPRLVFLSDGLGTPFRVALDVRGMAWAVEGDAAGAIRLAEP
jgi:general secretion pathway protein H